MQVMQIMQVMQVMQVIQVIQVVPSDGTNASGAIWWPNLQPMQVEPSGGKICN